MENNYPRRHGHKWSQQEVDVLRRRVGKGLPIEQIATFHGRSILAIECAMAKYHVKWNHVIDKKEPGGDYIINGVDYTRKFHLARKIVESVINGDTKYVRMNGKIWSEVTS